MKATKATCFCMGVLIVLSFGLRFAQATSKANRGVNQTIKDIMFNYYMQENSAKVVYTLEGNAKNAPCVFPFTFEKKTYKECTYDGCKHGKTWCATTDNYDKDKKWGHCQTDDEAPDCMDLHSNCGEWALDGECLTNPSYMRTSCPRSCGLCTFGGNGRGRACMFPFFFKNRLVYDCMHFNKKKWCAVTVNYNKDKRWGYCLPKLFKTMKQVNRLYLTWGECDDRHKKCSHWRSKGLCEKSSKRMDHWCPWSCYKCSPEKLVLDNLCRDCDSSCKTWAKIGLCTSSPVFMFGFCRSTCGLCYNSSSSITVYDRMPKQCPSWAKKGYCETHEKFMIRNCRTSCNAGGYVNGKMCLDSVTHCHHWAKEGYCSARGDRSRYSLQNNMKRHCRYSCKMCR